MAENVRLEEGPNSPHVTPTPYEGNTNSNRQTESLFMTLSSNISQFPPPTINAFLELTRAHPGMSLSSLLNIQRRQSQPPPVPPSSDSYTINLEDQTNNSQSSHDQLNHDHHSHQRTTENLSDNIHETTNDIRAEHHNNNISTDVTAADNHQISPETRTLLNVFQKYVPFVSILLAKGLYDHRAGILNFIVLLVTFIHANNDLKREIAKQQNRSWTSLLVIMCYITACIVFINFMFETHIFSPYTQPLTIWELLWSVAATDFVLKLITIVLKVILTCLPVRLLAFQKRGKYYLMVEATSQLYRCFAPIQPWLYYLFEAYQGAEKILGICLSIVYTVSKGIDVLSRVQLFRRAISKLLQNVSLGVSPTNVQLIASGGICAICHEEYSMPVRLHCKHIFCETCVSTWLDRERSCPLCRAPITDDPIYRDGHTTHFIQLY